MHDRKVVLRSMRLALCAAAMGLIGVTASGCEKSCRSGTLFLDVDLGRARQADALGIDVIIDGHTTHTSRSLPAGQARGGLEIGFPAGYPGGKTVTVTLTAVRNTVPIDTVSKMVAVGSGCTHASIAFLAGDLTDAGDGDGPRSDATGDARTDAGIGGAGGTGAGGRGGQTGDAGVGGAGVGGAGGPGTGGAGAGGAGAGGTSGNPTCARARDFSFDFPGSTQGFVLSDFDDPNQLNLGAPGPGAPPTLAYDNMYNDPLGAAASGSLRLSVNFTGYNQYVDVILDMTPSMNLAGKTACAQVRMTSGSFPGGVHFHASSSTLFDGYAGGPTIQLEGTTGWVTVPLTFDAPEISIEPWHSTDVTELGLQFFTGDPPFAGAPYPSQAGGNSFNIDTFID